MQFCCFNSGGQNYKMEAFPEWALFGGSEDNLSQASPLSLPWQLVVAFPCFADAQLQFLLYLLFCCCCCCCNKTSEINNFRKERLGAG